MVLDPMTALGLASNLLQFVDFSFKLFQGTISIYKSAAGSSEENSCLQLIVQDASRLSNCIEISENHPEELRRLAIEIKRLSQELLSALEELKINGKKTKWRSFQLAVKEVWNKEKIAGMSGRLSKLQAQLNTHLQNQTWNEVLKISEGLAEIELNDRRCDMRREREISAMKVNQAMIRDRFLKEAGEINGGAFQDSATKSTTDGDSQRAKHGNWMVEVQMLETLRADMKKMKQEQALLMSLWFDSISIRHGSIPKAHQNTFSWIFKGSTPDYAHPIRFVEWLRGNENVFWIQGKAGSGKSTLMKFLNQHPETMRHLGIWAGSHELVTASFYFWSSGSSLQKSQIGLVRSLLFEILRQCPDLLTQVWETLPTLKKQFFALHRSSKLDTTPQWQHDELLGIYQSVAEQNTISKFCFFIDGLDEYKPEREMDHRHLVKTLKVLSSSPSIKLCLSSRPWTIFSDAYGCSSEWTIKLEDLTRDDIYRYASDKLREHDQFDKLVQLDGSYTELVEEVARKAQGVFLWVFLVVRELLEGFTYNDTMGTMHLRLSQFPEDLGSYFQRMIDSIPKFYRRETAQMFRIALAKEEPSSLITYAFFDDISGNSMLQLEASQASPTVSEMLAIIDVKNDTMRRRLDGRCRGLLEVVELTPFDVNGILRFRVDFLHRTVRDYLQSSEYTLNIINEEGGSNASLWTNIYHAIFLTMRALQLSSDDRYIEHTASLWNDLLTFVSKALRENSDPKLVNYIIDRAMNLSKAMNPRRVLAQACRYGLMDYVRHKLDSYAPLVKTELAEEILPHALKPSPAFADLSPDLVAYLLEFGVYTNAKLNHGIKTETDPLSNFEKSLECGSISPSTQGVAEVVALLNAKGADIRPPKHVETRRILDESGGLNRKRTYDEEFKNGHYSIDGNGGYGEGSSQDKRGRKW